MVLLYIVRELEHFHRQREVKDEATKHQQNKLITFLQSKLTECKKKKVSRPGAVVLDEERCE